MPFANAVGTITKGSAVYNQAYLGIAGASTKTDNNAARYDANDNLEQEYVFSVMFRAPKAENVSAWLFCGTNNQTSLNHATLINGTKFGRGIEITNGNVYLYNNGEGFSTAEGTAINTEALNADEWYRAEALQAFPWCQCSLRHWHTPSTLEPVTTNAPSGHPSGICPKRFDRHRKSLWYPRCEYSCAATHPAADDILHCHIP